MRSSLTEKLHSARSGARRVPTGGEVVPARRHANALIEGAAHWLRLRGNARTIDEAPEISKEHAIRVAP